ncbi:Oxidoreductase swnN [Lachnellula suecica]|uniref:Oxidoreductase swnN n=1 Tax=Lachnellula suecica TaxID=602035 RepID=A0A8T9C7L6_9HELO|nr:Oxidoreductase swnN [Lachnellula suecica]
MVVVAIVGGTGNVGKTLVDAFKEDGKHEVIVLGRKVPEGGIAVPMFAVDYDSVEQLTKTLEENHVHTVISAIVLMDETAAKAERNLVAAASKSASTKRFVPSNWGNATPNDESMRIPHNGFRDQSAEALGKTDLEWTRIYNGLFLDYYGLPHVESHMTPLVFAVDIANKTAAIPGATGDEKISFTYTKDLGKFVVAAMDLPKWEREIHCESDNASLNEVVRIAEEMSGAKFNVTFDSVEKLRSGEVTELPSHPPLYQYIPKQMLAWLLSRFGLWAVYGIMYLPKEGSLNEKFPEIKTMTVREMISVWKGK